MLASRSRRRSRLAGSLRAAALVSLYARRLADGVPAVAVAFLFLFAFDGAGSTALFTGNLATLETLALWSGLALFVRGKELHAAVLLAIASAFKILPCALLLPLVLFLVPRRTKAIVVLPALATAIGLLAQLFLAPGWFRAWTVAVGETGWERGAINPSALALTTDVVGTGARHVAYAIVVASVLAALYALLRGRAAAMLGDEAGRRDLVMLLAVAYVIVAPVQKLLVRLRDPPLVHALRAASTARSAPRRLAGSLALSLLGAFSFTLIAPASPALAVRPRLPALVRGGRVFRVLDRRTRPWGRRTLSGTIPSNDGRSMLPDEQAHRTPLAFSSSESYGSSGRASIQENRCTGRRGSVRGSPPWDLGVRTAIAWLAALGAVTVAPSARAQATSAAPEGIAVGEATLTPTVELRARGEYRRDPVDMGGAAVVPAAPPRVRNAWLVFERTRVGLGVERGALRAQVTLQDARAWGAGGALPYGSFAPFEAYGEGARQRAPVMPAHRAASGAWARGA